MWSTPGVTDNTLVVVIKNWHHCGLIGHTFSPTHNVTHDFYNDVINSISDDVIQNIKHDVNRDISLFVNQNVTIVTYNINNDVNQIDKHNVTNEDYLT